MELTTIKESQAGVMRSGLTKKGSIFYEVVNRNFTYRMTTHIKSIAENAFNLLK